MTKPFPSLAHQRSMDFIVLSHLRWDFVFQRPQHLMTRCSRANRVFFWEEPVFDAETSRLEVRELEFQLRVVVPHLPAGLSTEEVSRVQEWLMERLLEQYRIQDYTLWYYTPLALHFTRQLQPTAVVYDCMDELSAFRGAPPGLRAAETELFSKADLVFTGGRSLYESKKFQHDSVHCFPSSIDRDFFATARRPRREPTDQALIPSPRLGFCGVIDERLNVELLGAIADLRPDWQIVMIGPVVKLDPAEVPHRRNIHYLGAKGYRELPLYLGGWDVGLLPFAQNEATRFISPTKTPEYLAAGLPVVSTPIADVVNPYGTKGLVEIAKTPEEFVHSIERAMATRNSVARLTEVDEFLSHMSWDLTWERMNRLIEDSARRNTVSGDETRVARSDSAAAD